MGTRYVLADLVRNPRRTLATMIGITLGVGLLCGVLFFVDGLSATMTQRAVAPLPIDMQRVVTERVGGSLTVTQTFDRSTPLAAGDRGEVRLEIHNTSKVAANEVTVRSLPAPRLAYVPGSATLDGAPAAGGDDNPLDHGPGHTGLNVGSLAPGSTHRLTYELRAEAEGRLDATTVTSTYSSRESVSPVAVDQESTVGLDTLAAEIAKVDGVASAHQLSSADLGPGTISAGGGLAPGPAKIFGFDASYDASDDTIDLVEGAFSDEGGVLSAELAARLGLGLGDIVTVRLPDRSTMEVTVSGIADLTRSRSLFSSRRGGDLETFAYTATSVIVSLVSSPGPWSLPTSGPPPRGANV